MFKISKPWLLAVLVPLFAIAATPVAAQAAPRAAPATDYGSFLDEFVSAQLARYRIPGAAVVIVDRERQVLAKGYGFADAGRRTPVSPDRTGFFIASTTKLWTTAAVMQLVDQGRLDLHADVNRYLTDFKIRDTYPGRPITLTNLLTHTSGFADGMLGAAVRDPADAQPLGEYLAQHQPDRVRPPGTLAAYDNYGFALAGYLVEVVSGQPFDEYVAEHLLRPLGMSGSTVAQPHPAAIDATLAHGYRPDGDRQASIDGQYGPMVPAGAGAVSTAADMGRFLGAQLRDDPSSPMRTQQFTHDPRLPGMALGWEEHPRNGNRILSKDGDVPGFHSNAAIVPDKGIGIFIVYNGDGVDGNGFFANKQLVDAFVDRFYPGDSSAPIATADPDGALDRYAGNYRVTRTEEDLTKAATLMSSVSVSVEGDGTLTTTGPLSADPDKLVQHWVPVGDRLFQERDGQDRLAFRVGPDGAVTALITTANPTVAYQRLAWWQSPVLHQVLLAGSLLILVATALCWPLVALIRRLRGRAVTQGGGAWARAARIAAWVTAALATAFTVVLAILFSDGNQLQERVVLGSPLFITALALSTVALVGTVATIAGTVAAWRGRWWGPAGRLHHTAVSIAAVTFVGVAAVYHLVVG